LKGPNIKSLPKLDPLPEAPSFPSCSRWATISRPTRSCRPEPRYCPIAATSPRFQSSCSGPSTETIRGGALAAGQHAIVAGENYGPILPPRKSAPWRAAEPLIVAARTGDVDHGRFQSHRTSPLCHRLATACICRR
jgi:hypothetical protein